MEPEGWVRLHPLSPLLDAGRYVLLAAVLIIQLFADQVIDVEPGVGLVARILAVVTACGLVAFGYSALAWRFRMYRVTESVVELKTGVVFRSYRHLPLERIESVDMTLPLIPRLLGLAEVRIEAISKQGSELRLRYLAEADAERLRDELTALGRVGAPEVSPAAVASSVILEVPPRELLWAYVVVPALAGAAVLLAAAVVVGLAAGWEAAVVLVVVPVLSAPVAVVPVLIRLERLWNFKLEDHQEALVVKRGLLNLDTQRILPGRIQAVRVDQPLLWRLYGRFRVVVDVAGYRAGGDDAIAAATILPVAPDRVVRYLVQRLGFGDDLAGLPRSGVPGRARWRSLRWRGFAVAFTEAHAVMWSGVLWRRTVVVPHLRVQSVRVMQGPWQRRLGLATLRVDTAGPRIRAVAAHREVGEAVDLARRSARLSRQAVG